MNSLRGPVTLLKDAWTLFKGHAWLFIGIYIIPAILTIVYSMFVALVFSPYAGGAIQAAAIPFIILLTVLLVVISIVSSVALIKAVSVPTETTIKSAYQFGLKHFWSYVWLSILTGLAVIGGLILLVIPGIIFMIWFAFGYFILVLEGKRGTEAMKASREYVRGKWFAVFGRILVLMVVLMLVSGVVAGILSAFIGGANASEGAEAVTNILNIFLVPFSIAYMYLLYQDLKKVSVAKAVDSETSTPPAENVGEQPESTNPPASPTTP